MIKEFNLSKKKRLYEEGKWGYYYDEDDVKKFIRLRNELDIKFRSCKMSWKEYREERNKLAGKELVEEGE